MEAFIIYLRSKMVERSNKDNKVDGVIKMGTIVNQIEKYLKRLLNSNNQGFIEIKRTELAEIFMCAPSQINYVLETRFGNAQGYHVESKRGGGGYLRIVKLGVEEDEGLLVTVNNLVGKLLSQQSGEGLIVRLEEEGFLTRREAIMIKSIMDNDTLVDPLNRDMLRSRIVRSVLITLLREDL